MAKFQDPPLRTTLHKVAPTKDRPEGILNDGWQRYFISSTNRHSQPNVPVVTIPPVTGNAGDIRVTSNFLFVCVQDHPTVIWKKVALT